MKCKVLFILIFFLCLLKFSSAQTYISGVGVIPFDSVATSSYLPTSARISYSQALSKVNSFTRAGELPLTSARMSGEYFLIDSVVFNIAVRPRTVNNEFSPLSKIRDTYRWMAAAGGDSEDVSAIYYDNISTYSNFEALISYFKVSNSSSFIIQDTAGGYVCMGRIYHKVSDANTAHTLLTQILNSITFK